MVPLADMKQLPFISCMQKIAIYETTSRYYVVGSNHEETRFRVLKIDRTEPKELHITDDRVEYTQRQIRDLLRMIDVGNRPKLLQSRGGLSRAVTAFGIVGFVRFLEGYYVILITKRRRVANIGPHTIYKIEDTSTLYIPNPSLTKNMHPDEARYLKIFHNVDLSSNFYFSYSYDLTRTLQYNMTPCADINNADEDNNDNTQQDEVLGIRTLPTEEFVWNHHLLQHIETLVHCDWLLHITHGFVGQSNICVFGRSLYLTVIGRRSNKFAGTRYLKRGANADGHVANEVETEQIVHDSSVVCSERGRYTSYVQHRGSVPALWSQDISKMVPKPTINIDQSDAYCAVAGKHFNRLIKRYGAPIIILNLVKKREKKLHEGVLSDIVTNMLQYLNQFLPSEHNVAYIGFDMARISKSKDGNVLQRLGEIADFCVKRTGFYHSGPLLYTSEMRPHPRCKGMSCFAPYITHASTGTLATDDTATSVTHDNGLFDVNDSMSRQRKPNVNNSKAKQAGCRQTGVVRTNCVDCLDRTNTAQFVLGKCALAFQLYSLGVIDSPQLEFDTDCVRMLEELYEDHGDTLALQYGGSQLVHRIKSYRKIAPWTSSSRDIMQSLSRYYSNAFSDTEKQQALNLFLGVYRPTAGIPNLWDLPTDVYLHNPRALHMAGEGGTTNRGRGDTRSYSQWWDSPVYDALPYPYEEVSKGENNKLMVVRTSRQDEHINLYHEFYRPYELTSFMDLYSLHMPNSIRDYMPKFAMSMSPFAVRVQPVRRVDDTGVMLPPQVNPNISGKDSTASHGSTGSEASSSDSEGGGGSDKDLDLVIVSHDDVASHNGTSKDTESGSRISLTSLKDLFPTMKQTYGTSIEKPDRESIMSYTRCAQLGKVSTARISKRQVRNISTTTNIIQRSIFPLDSCYAMVPPTVTIQSKAIYQINIGCGRDGPTSPSKHDIALYKQYVYSQYNYR